MCTPPWMEGPSSGSPGGPGNVPVMALQVLQLGTPRTEQGAWLVPQPRWDPPTQDPLSPIINSPPSPPLHRLLHLPCTDPSILTMHLSPRSLSHSRFSDSALSRFCHEFCRLLDTRELCFFVQTQQEHIPNPFVRRPLRSFANLPIRPRGAVDGCGASFRSTFSRPLFC